MCFRAFVLFATLFLSGLFCLVDESRAATPPDPTEQFRPYVERIVAILTDPALQGEEKCVQRREMVMQVASERFDFEEMSKRVLGRTWRQLSRKEKDHFISLFTRLLEHAYIGKIEDYSRQQVVFRDQRVRGDRAQVDTAIIDKDVAVSVSYIMILKGDVWRVYDIVVEGVSLIRNYMEQFKEILRKEGYPSLLKQVEDKVAELEKEIGKPCPVELDDTKGS
ncbi:MAG: ABC transporter substrate-binding protein [Desulfobulbaceae bacterium]